MRKANNNSEVAESGRWSCVDYSGTGGDRTRNQATEPNGTKGLHWRFGDVTKHEQKPAATHTSHKVENGTTHGWPGTGSGNDTANAVATELTTKLNPTREEQGYWLALAGHSWAEVV